MGPLRFKSSPFFLWFCLSLSVPASLCLAHAGRIRAFLGRTMGGAFSSKALPAGRLPLCFEPNRGQTDPRVKFLSRGAGYTLFLTAQEAVLALQEPARPVFPGASSRHSASPVPSRPPQVLRLKLEGACRAVSWKGTVRLPGISNYFIGNDPSKWRTKVPQYGRVVARDVYPGIDMVYDGRQGRLEYDFVVRPGADPDQIRLACEGVRGTHLDPKGNLVLGGGKGAAVFEKPVAYQGTDEGTGRKVESRYVRGPDGRIGFGLGAYDPYRPLVIDPALAYSTFLGAAGGASSGHGIAVDPGGNAYVTGVTSSAAFPVQGGAYQGAYGGGFDVFVSKLNATGTALLYSTYLGGSGYENGFAIALDPGGNAYVTGKTDSVNFPTTPGAFQTAFGGGIDNAFVAKLNPSGTALVYSTYLGGNNDDEGYGIAVDPGGNAYVTGWAASGNFPTTPGAFQTLFGGTVDAFAAKLNPAGSALVYSTYLGGTGSDFGSQIALDAGGNAYVAGTASGNFPTTPGAFQTLYGGNPADGFVSKLNATGTALVYSTYLGGSNGDQVFGIALDPAGNAHVTGFTGSANFPSTAGAFRTALTGNPNAFAAELNAGGTGLVYSTFLGGSGSDTGIEIALEPDGSAEVAGYTTSTDFPTTAGAYQTSFGGVEDVFLTRLNPTGTGAAYSTYLGGSRDEYGYGIAVDGVGGVYLTGSTNSVDFPATAGAYRTANSGSDAFAAKFAFATPTPVPPPPTPTCPIHVWPNPFSLRYAGNHALKISCLPEDARVSIYTLSGELVDRFGRWGDPTLWVDGVNLEGRTVSPGIYFYVIEGGSSVLQRGKFLVTP